MYICNISVPDVFIVLQDNCINALNMLNEVNEANIIRIHILYMCMHSKLHFCMDRGMMCIHIL